MFKILVVEDDYIMNETICEYLKECGHKVESAFTGKEALEKYSHKIDLILLDIMLPEINGLEVLKIIRKECDIPIIMLTALNDENMQISSFDQLADDYITKPFSIAILGRRINAIMRRRGIAVPINVWRYDKLTVDFSGFSAEISGKQIDIAPKEILLLQYLVENKGRVLTRNQILDHVWGQEEAINDRTVDSYIARLRKKLVLDDIITIKGIGYKFEEKIE